MGNFVPNAVNADSANNFRRLGNDMIADLPLPNNVREGAEGEYKEWLKNKTGEKILEETEAFIAKIKDEKKPEIQQAKALMLARIADYKALAKKLSEMTIDNYNPAEIRALADRLTGTGIPGEDGYVPGFSDAVRILDKVTGYACSKNNAFKSLFSMSCAVDSTVTEVEWMAIKEHDESIERRNEELTIGFRMIDGYKQTAEAFVKQCEADGYHAGDREEAEKMHGKIRELRDYHTKQKDMIEKSIPVRRRERDDADNIRTLKENALTTAKGVYAAENGKLERMKGEMHEAETALTENANKLVDLQGRLKKEEEKYKSESKAYDDTYSKMTKRIPDDLLEKYRIFSSLLSRTEETRSVTRQVNSPMQPINGKTNARLIKALKKGTADGLTEDEQMYFMHLSAYADAEDVLASVPTEDGIVIRGKEVTPGIQKAIDLLTENANANKKLPKGVLGPHIKDALNERITETSEKLKKQCDECKILNENFGFREDIQDKRTEFQKKSRARQDELKKQIDAQEKKTSPWTEKCADFTMKTAEMENNVEQYRKSTDFCRSEFENADKAYKDAVNKYDAAVEDRRKVQEDLDRYDEIEERLNKVENRQQELEEERNRMVNKCGTLRAKGGIRNFSDDDRMALYHRRLAGFAARINENKGRHNNGPEYQKMVDMLASLNEMTKPGAVDEKGEKMTTNKLKFKMSQLGDRAHEYLEARGKDVMSAIYQSEFRHMRLNFARELDTFCDSARAALEHQSRKQLNTALEQRLTADNDTLAPHPTFEAFHGRVSRAENAEPVRTGEQIRVPGSN